MSYSKWYPWFFTVEYYACPPWWAGFVWHHPERRASCYAPVGISTAIRAWLLFWNWLRFPFRQNAVEHRIEWLRKRIVSVDHVDACFQAWELERLRRQLENP